MGHMQYKHPLTQGTKVATPHLDFVVVWAQAYVWYKWNTDFPSTTQNVKYKIN